jgi:ADP-ribose pyrophosphatase YjhB (NUDIX family)
MGYISDIRKKIGHDPVFMPASGCSIVKDHKILLQKRSDNGRWAMHGGALASGETFEEAFLIEVKE